MMNGMGKESRRKKKNRVCNGRLFVGCVDLSFVAMETKQKALEWAIYEYLELLKVVALSALSLQSLWRGENKDNVQSKVYSYLEYCYYYCFLHHNNYHSIFLLSISFPHLLIFNVSVINQTVKSTCSSRDVHVNCWLIGSCMKPITGDIIC